MPPLVAWLDQKLRLTPSQVPIGDVAVPSVTKRNVRFVQFYFDQCLHGHSLPPPVDSQAGLQLDFRQWVQREVAAGNIAFTAKGEASPEQPQGGELPEQSVAAEQPAVAVARAFA